MYTFIKTNGLWLETQPSSFIPGDSTINQLIAICDQLYRHIDLEDEIIEMFLDLSKALNRVWHDGLLHILNALPLMEGFLRCCKPTSPIVESIGDTFRSICVLLEESLILFSMGFLGMLIPKTTGTTTSIQGGQRVHTFHTICL